MTSEQQMDDLARFNKERWEELARAGIEYGRPMLDLEPASARRVLDPHGVMGEVAGLDVLCLASGGGQQSVAFALLGARVTVFDLSETQLESDRLAAAHYGLAVEAVQGDMRKLDVFADRAFDIVFQAFSLNFVPDVHPVHGEVARILRTHGIYRLEWSNPFTQTVDPAGWNADSYPMRHQYVDGREINEFYPHWDVADADGNVTTVVGPKEFVHTLSTMVNSLADHGFVIIRASEDAGDDHHAEPGSWPHFMSVAVPYLTLWSRYLPDVFHPYASTGD